MILAAGLGTRLRPLTDKIPKALVPIGDTPILGIVLEKLLRSGFTHIAVNAHHHSEQVRDYLAAYKTDKNIYLDYSYEPTILDTGGGIKRMLAFFRDAETPILVHNVDILSALNFRDLMRHHVKARAAATLVVNKRQTDRPLSFTDKMEFLGRSRGDLKKGDTKDFGFCGVQVIQPALFRDIDKDKFYSIDVYVNAAKEQEKIIAYDISGIYWRDIGTTDDLDLAEMDYRQGRDRTFGRFLQ
jgi:NDP-sugar pyrophosphorylase family protein